MTNYEKQIVGKPLRTAVPSFLLKATPVFMAGEYLVFHVPYVVKVPNDATIVNQNLRIYAVKAESVTLEAQNATIGGFGSGEIIYTKIPSNVAGICNLVNETQNILPIVFPDKLALSGSARDKIAKLVTPQSMFQGFQVLVIPSGEFRIVTYQNNLGIDFIKAATSDTQDAEKVEA